MCKSTIAQLLLDNSALPEGGTTHGALHGAIYNKMFKTIKIMLDRGCQVNEYYINQTPLGAALTCGPSRSGDVRLVRILLAAEADVQKTTKMRNSPFKRGSMVHPIILAKKYSNAKCQGLVKTVEEQNKSDS